MDTPIKTWRELVASKKLFHDPAQERAAQMLTLLQARLQNWQPRKKPKLFGRTAPQPKGIYLYGEVGRGKSMLMDMFYSSAPVTKKSRVHFQDFMQIIHRQISRWREMDEPTKRKHPNFVRGAGDDPIASVAKGIFAEAHLICFDEFQVSDITDAMLLSRLFEHLFALGIVMVATSNRPPEGLYKDGLNRQRFLPFISLLNQRLDVLDLAADRDYRQDGLRKAELYITPLSSNSKLKIDALWQKIIVGGKAYSRKFIVLGRELEFENTFGGAVRLSFSEICDRALASADYLEFAKQFHTVLLENVPVLAAENRNQAKRFVMLIDALYEARVKLIISADAEPEELYQGGDGSFEFARCASRLVEMRSDSWAQMSHGGKGLVV
ncbi:MAG: AFG1 family ATPase [Robiginitomaculum sp.]|nr:AFG1 family ATPase [Robiginitomaculum sp.]